MDCGYFLYPNHSLLGVFLLIATCCPPNSFSNYFFLTGLADISVMCSDCASPLQYPLRKNKLKHFCELLPQEKNAEV